MSHRQKRIVLSWRSSVYSCHVCVEQHPERTVLTVHLGAINYLLDSAMSIPSKKSAVPLAHCMRHRNQVRWYVALPLYRSPRFALHSVRQSVGWVPSFKSVKESSKNQILADSLLIAIATVDATLRIRAVDSTVKAIARPMIQHLRPRPRPRPKLLRQWPRSRTQSSRPRPNLQNQGQLDKFCPFKTKSKDNVKQTYKEYWSNMTITTKVPSAYIGQQILTYNHKTLEKHMIMWNELNQLCKDTTLA